MAQVNDIKATQAVQSAGQVNDIKGSSAASSDMAQVLNRGERRIVIGPPPKSQRNASTSTSGTVLGSRDDQTIVEAQRLSNAAAIPKALTKSAAFKAVAERCSVAVA